MAFGRGERFVAGVWALAVALCPPAPAAAQPAAPGAGAPAPQPAPATAEAPADAEGGSVARPGDDAAKELAAELRSRAEAVVALTEGLLDAQIDAATLWTVDLGQPALAAHQHAEKLLRLLADAQRSPAQRAPTKRRGRPVEPRVPPPPEGADALTQAVFALADAYAGFLALPEARREARLRAHEEKRRELSARAAAEQRKRQRAAALEQQVAELDAFLRGELALDRDPAALLAVDVAELAREGRLERLQAAAAPAAQPTDEAAEAAPAETGAAQSARRAPDGAVGPGESAPGEVEAGSAAETLDARIAELTRHLDALRARYLALPPGERSALFERHQERRRQAEEQARTQAEAREMHGEAEEAAGAAKQEAQAAARARREALQAARDARSQALRMLEQERARLLGVREAQAHYKEALNKERIAARQRYEQALVWKGKVDALLSRSVLEGPKAPDADRLYPQLRAELRRTRGDLHRALDAVTRGHSDAPKAAPLIELPVLDAEDIDALHALWTEVQRQDAALREIEDGLAWTKAELLRDAMVMLNLERLRLLQVASPELRETVTGFGAAGVEQVRGELSQTLLQLRYHAMTLPRYSRELRDRLWASPVTVIWELLKLAFLLTLFRLWHTRARSVLTSLHRWAREQARGGAPTRKLVTLAWYLRRIYKPLDWLILVNLLLGGQQTLPELQFAHLVASWFLIGSIIVLFLDGVAARRGQRGRKTDETAALRLRTLRLLGLIVVVTGLILSISSLSVGRGAIHAWVTTLCWFLALPVGAVIVYWWRPTIFERLASQRSHNALTRRALALRDHRGSMLGAAAGGLYLLLEGIQRWLTERLQAFQAFQRVMAYVFRARVARKSRLATALPSRAPVGEDEYPALRDDAPPSPLIESVWTQAIEALLLKAKSPHNTVSALVGERGSGKSALLARLVETLGKELNPDACLLVSCPPEGFSGFLERLAGMLEVGAEPSAVGAAIVRRAVRVVCIDDAHRLVRPRVGGTVDLERFEALARGSGEVVSFVLSFDAMAWSFIERAQSDRLTFSHVARLRAWSESEIAELLRSRTELAGLDPDFDEIALPRQIDEFGEDDSQVEGAYFRMLWDSSGGNPTAALRLWRKSLCRREDGSIVVRLFAEQNTEPLERSPLNSLCILRTLVQMDLADLRELALCTNLDENVVFDTLRHATAEGYIEHVGTRLRLSFDWYRPVTRVLRRQRLLPT